MTVQHVVVVLLVLLALAELFGITPVVGSWRYVETVCYLKVNGVLVSVEYVDSGLVIPLNPLFSLVNSSGLDIHNLCLNNNTLLVDGMVVACSCCEYVIDSSRIVFSNIVVGLVLLGSLWVMVRRSEFEVL